ncbi:glutathione transferase GstA [Frischella sp. Ac48]|uniref:glutathione transferase GstA n=1 Tax=Frischella sp. Ac48 TaxID=2804531 RepID=UPI001C7D2C73|nr:glutathione transferase GstA [Frischella sp. Ac48]MBX4134305.1 glutathione transferase GstA [Frischella sp. Ac48]
MKLYYSPFACSLTQHILLCMSGLNYSVEKVDLKTKKTEHGANFYDINPEGQVPTLELDDGTILTENIAIAQYIADKATDAKLIASVGKIERYQTLSWLSFVGTELHPAFLPLFKSDSESVKNAALIVLEKKLAHVEQHLTHRQFIATNSFTIADAYLYVVLNWLKYFKLTQVYPAIEQYVKHIETIPAVQQAVALESK